MNTDNFTYSWHYSNVRQSCYRGNFPQKQTWRLDFSIKLALAFITSTKKKSPNKPNLPDKLKKKKKASKTYTFANLLSDACGNQANQMSKLKFSPVISFTLKTQPEARSFYTITHLDRLLQWKYFDRHLHQKEIEEARGEESERRRGRGQVANAF